MKKYCFMDFDGTLVSNEDRLYQFYLDNIDEEYKQYLSRDEFWRLKKMGIHEIDWINSKFKINLDKIAWTRKKVELIENSYYLSYDRLFPFVHETLKILKEQYHIVLISRRENAIGLRKQITDFQLEQYFYAVEVIDHNSGSKADYISSRYDVVRDKSIWVGDTEDDMEAGTMLGIDTYLVLSGIRDRWITYTNEKFKNVRIIDDIRGITG